MKLIMATNNAHKVEEIRSLLQDTFELLSLKDAGIDIDIPEPHPTLEQNALEKAETIYRLTKSSTFSEDTGLEVYLLNGEPGVRSARYAGEPSDAEKNIDLVLSKMKREIDRSARFRTVICLMLNGEANYFEGICEGRLTRERKGEKGFGYDSIFIPSGSDKTFAQMTSEEKNKFSHRARAVEALVVFLKNMQKGRQN